MPCTERTPALALLVALAALAGGCNQSPVLPTPPATRAGPSPAPAHSPTTTPAAGTAAVPKPPTVARPLPQTAPNQKPAPAAAPRAAARARDWDSYRVQAAQRLVEANPTLTYLGEVPEPLLAIPVLEIELNGDGSVRQIQVMRHPRQALDTVQLAIAAVRRAAPFGEVSHLPRPWKFTEVFLFDDQRRFKPRALDL